MKSRFSKSSNPINKTWHILLKFYFSIYAYDNIKKKKFKKFYPYNDLPFSIFKSLWKMKIIILEN